MTADQRVQLLNRVVRDELSEKLSYKDCEKIAKDLNLTLEQVRLSSNLLA
jgi:general transcription factor 3C polypeptide 1